jgi:predicted DNA-binding protein (MmcQ/YjbR family)
MTRDDYNAFCASLPHATHVVQWGDHDVWKVGGKVFAIAGSGADAGFNVTFKCSELGFEILKEQPGLRPRGFPAPPFSCPVHRRRSTLIAAALQPRGE